MHHFFQDEVLREKWTRFNHQTSKKSHSFKFVRLMAHVIQEQVYIPCSPDTFHVKLLVIEVYCYSRIQPIERTFVPLKFSKSVWLIDCKTCIFRAILCVSTDCQGSQDISLIMDVYRLALKVNYYYFSIKFY